MPRNITVYFSDGTAHQYNNAPDNVTPDQIEQRIKRDYANKKIVRVDGGNKAAPTAAGQQPMGKWKSSTVRGSDIDSPGRQVYSLESNNTVDLGFPYGKTKMILHVRLENGKIDKNGGIFITSAGQFYDSNDSDIRGGTLRYKIDSAPTKRAGYTSSASGSTGTAFFTDEEQVLQDIKSGKIMKIQISYFQKGKEIFEFDIAGLPIQFN